MSKKKSNSIKIVLFFVLASFNALAQESECKQKLAAFEEFARTNNYDDSTYAPWLELKKKCPKYDESVYLIGQKILKQKIYQANASEAKNVMISELASLYDEHDKVFPNNHKGNAINKALLLYENKNGTPEEIYTFLDKAFKTSNAEFTSPNALNIYAELLVAQFEAGDKGISADQALEKLDQISEKVQTETKVATQTRDNLQAKAQTLTLSSEENNSLSIAKNSIEELTIVSQNLNGNLNKLANCEALIAYYGKNFEKNAENALWLERVSERLSSRKCKSDLFAKATEKLHALSPSSKSAYNMAVLSRSAKNNKLAIDYFKQSAELEADSNKKAELYYTIATTYGYTNKTEARQFAQKVLELKPSMGKAYTYIAQLYANSTNDCGENDFESRAIYWLASETAKKAGVVEPVLKKSADELAAGFLKKAPSKQEISQAKRKAGETISYKCWIGQSISIPKL